MTWRSSRMEMPEEWWDALREKDELPKWFKTLTVWAESFGWTHMFTLTFRRKLSSWEARRRYFRFLAEHASTWMVRRSLWAVEQHPGGHGSHIHALWSTQFDTSGASSAPLWRHTKETSVNDGLGFSRLWPLDEQKLRVAAYCLKYVVKGLKAMRNARTPMPWEPTEQEPLWGMWTPTAVTRGRASTRSRGADA